MIADMVDVQIFGGSKEMNVIRNEHWRNTYLKTLDQVSGDYEQL